MCIALRLAQAAAWQTPLDGIAARHGTQAPRVMAVPSPFRFVTSPILKRVREVQSGHPGLAVAVMIAELVASPWC